MIDRGTCKRGVISSATAERAKLAVDDSRARRAAALRGIRLQSLTQRSVVEAANYDRSLEAIARTVREALHASQVGLAELLHKLRLTLAYPHTTAQERDDAFDAALRAGLVRVLASALKPALPAAETASAALQASWIAADMVAEHPPCRPALLQLSPLLIAHLAGSYGPDLSLQCAWTLANLAAADGAAAPVLLTQGAAHALAQLLDEGVRQGSSARARDAAATAGWALCNLTEAADSKMQGNLLNVPGMAAVLRRALGEHAAYEAACEAAWLLARLLAGDRRNRGTLIDSSLSHALCSALAAAVDACDAQFDGGGIRSGMAEAGDEVAEQDWVEGSSWQGREASQLLVPLLRCFGNYVPLAGRARITEMATWRGALLLRAVLRACSYCEPFIAQEAAWVLANLASRQEAAEQLNGMHAAAHIAALLCDASDVQKAELCVVLYNLTLEAATSDHAKQALCSIAQGGARLFGDLVRLAGSTQEAAAAAAAHLCNSLLEHAPESAGSFHQCGAMEAMLKLIKQPFTPDLVRQALTSAMARLTMLCS